MRDPRTPDLERFPELYGKWNRRTFIKGAAAGTALVTGSFHTVGDALARLPGLTPLG